MTRIPEKAHLSFDVISAIVTFLLVANESDLHKAIARLSYLMIDAEYVLGLELVVKKALLRMTHVSMRNVPAFCKAKIGAFPEAQSIEHRPFPKKYSHYFPSAFEAKLICILCGWI